MRRAPALLALPGLTVYFALALSSAHAVGLVGEVAIGWAAHSPVVWTDFKAQVVSPEAPGPLVARQTRPTLSLGGWPLTINGYTGGLADWPAKIIAGSFGWQAAAWTAVALGALLLTLATRFLRFHAPGAAGVVVGVLLGTDWAFVFYKRVLGGTEVLLQAAGLLALWSLWSRRWRGGVHGSWGLALAVLLGLHAKLTFGATLLAIALTAVLTHRDRPALVPPSPVRWVLLASATLFALSPYAFNFWLQSTLPPGAAVVSHDTLALQLGRLSLPGTEAMDRESLRNLLAFFGELNAFWGWALKAQAPAPFSSLRALGFGLGLMGTVLAWAEQRGAPSPSDALLRFLSVLCPLQLALLTLANRDLHHLAQSTVFLNLWLALALTRLAAQFTRARSVGRVALLAVFTLPTAFAGIRSLVSTDAVMESAPASTFQAARQLELIALLRAHPGPIVTSDYEIYGILEARAPDIRAVHTWAALSRRSPDAYRLLLAAREGHYLALRPTAPMIYNWNPSDRALAVAADAAGVRVVEVARLNDADGAWARLYAVK